MLQRLVAICMLLVTASTFALTNTDPFANNGAQSGDGVLQSGPRFLPVAQAYPLTASIEAREIVLDWNITPGYYLYRPRMSFAIREGDQRQTLDISLPPGEAHEDAYLGATEVYRGLLQVRLPLQRDSTFVLELKSQGCADAGLCYPPRTQLFEVDPVLASAVEIVDAPTPGAAPLTQATSGGGVARLAYMALLAALGGLILNLMPCVFPILSLKLLSFGGNGANHKAMHGLVYTAGVVLSFIAIAGVLLALRAGGAAIGWGFHLQSPIFVASLTYLFFVMGLSLSGLLTLGAGLMGSGNSLASLPGYSGSFFTGVLATVVASPCTAPFMGTALGFALTQSAGTALLIFAALGLGMASPFLLFSLVPGLRRYLPKPGAWMEGFRQFLAFPLYLAAVWLLWVLGKQSGVNGMAAVAVGCVCLALALWLWERARQQPRPMLMRAFALLTAILAVLILRSPLLSVQQRAIPGEAEAWEAYSTSRLTQLRGQGKPVFLNVTADWCITCLANEQVALSNRRVMADFAEHGVVYLKADWTNADPAVTRLLQSFGRGGVPLYVVYPATSTAQPRILPQLLTPDIVRQALKSAGGRNVLENS